MKYLLLFTTVLIFGFVSSKGFNPLNSTEKEGILYMREEEKLARDVYETLFEKYNSNPFANIRHSEQNHMDRMEMLIQNYKLADPLIVTKDARGKFVNTKLQRLYNDLVKKGNVSFTEALKVGAAIEEIDIDDLNSELAKTDKQDIINVYTALKRASEHHLNAFVGRLKREGVDYRPIALSQKEFDEIIANDSRGKGMGRRGETERKINRENACGNRQKSGCCEQGNK